MTLCCGVFTRATCSLTASLILTVIFRNLTIRRSSWVPVCRPRLGRGPAATSLRFARWTKLPGLAGEALGMSALWRFCGRPAFAVYALCPAAILISGFHGNTDCLYVALVLVAAIAFDRQRYFLSGLLWSAALNVKLMPLVLIPMVVSRHTECQWPRSGSPGSGLAVGLALFLPACAHNRQRPVAEYADSQFFSGQLGHHDAAQ